MRNVVSGSYSKRTESRRIRDLPISKVKQDRFSFMSKLLIRKVEDKNMKTWISKLKSVDDARNH